MKSFLLPFILSICFTFSIWGQNTDLYLLEYNKNEPQLIHVQSEFLLTDSVLQMSQQGSMPERWTQYVRDIQLWDGDGKSIPIDPKDSTGWIIQNAPLGEVVQLEYKLLLTHEEVAWPGGIDGVAFIREWGVTACGRSIFVVPRKDEGHAVKVSIQLPDSWKAAVPWTQKGGAYQVPNRMQLLESFLTFGTQEVAKLRREGFQLTFVLGGPEVIKEKGRYLQNAQSILDYYILMMGGVPVPAPGQELSNVLVIINEGTDIDGEVIGNHINLFLDPNAPPQQQIIGWFLFAHEFFHLWNGKTLRFEGTKCDWFKEGITNYYTLKALHHSGLAEENTLFQVMNGLFYQRYINDSGLGKLAPVDAASGFDKDNHWGLVYGGGLFAGICIDFKIRSQSQNEQSLDAVMRHLYQETGGADRLISNKTLVQSMEDVGQASVRDILDMCIFGTQKVPLSTYLPAAGWEVSTDNRQLNIERVDKPTALQLEIHKGFLGKLTAE